MPCENLYEECCNVVLVVLLPTLTLIISFVSCMWFGCYFRWKKGYIMKMTLYTDIVESMVGQ